MDESKGFGDNELPTARPTRRQFLRQSARRLAITLAAGAGLALLQAGQAQAACSTCCRDSTCPTCSGTAVRFRCTPGNCCICHDPVGTNCFSTQQCQC